MGRNLTNAIVLWAALIGAPLAKAQTNDTADDRSRWDRWLRSARSATDSSGTVAATGLSRTHQNNGDLDSALAMAQQAILLARAGLDATAGRGRARWLNHLLVAQRMMGAQLFFLNRYPESIEAINSYLVTAEELQLPEEIGAAYNYLGYCYTAMEDLPSALAWSRKAMVTMRGIGDGIDLANAYTGLGNILDEMGQGDSALFYFHKALDLHRTLDRPNNHAATLFSTIETLRHLGWPDSVDAYLLRVQPLVALLDQPRSDMNYLNLLGQRAVEMGNSKEGIVYLLTADSISVAIEDHRSRHFINRSLALAYAAIGNVKEASLRAELADAEMKEDMGLEKVRAVAAAQAKAEQEKELATAAANAEAYNKGRWLAWSVAGGGIAIAVLLGMLYRQSRKNTRRLTASNRALVETQDELMRVGKEREAEVVRTRVARDIHDELGGSLSKIALLSDLVQQEGSPAEERAQRLRSIADHARQIRGSLNDVVWAADPSSDSAGSFMQYIADRAHRLLDGTGVDLQLNLHVQDPDLLLDPAFKHDLSMVVKEALNNALKHAQPKIIQLRFQIDTDRFGLAIADDGRGLGHSPTDGGNGLVNMRARIAAHGGSLSVNPAGIGTGTLVEAHGPLIPR